MDDEEAFQRALDKNPDDHTLRTIFADWLQEHGDKRAEGYRAMGLNCLRPFITEKGLCWWSLKVLKHESMGNPSFVLPNDWFRKLSPSIGNACWPDESVPRRKCEDGAAIAFLRLPAKRRAALLIAALAEPHP